MVVVLPAPFAPKNPKISAKPISKETPLTAIVWPKHLASPFREITGSVTCGNYFSALTVRASGISLAALNQRDFYRNHSKLANEREPLMTVLSPFTTHQWEFGSGNYRCATRSIAKQREQRRKHDQNKWQLKYKAGDDRDREWFQHR